MLLFCRPQNYSSRFDFRVDSSFDFRVDSRFDSRFDFGFLPPPSVGEEEVHPLLRGQNPGNQQGNQGNFVFPDLVVASNTFPIFERFCPILSTKISQPW